MSARQKRGAPAPAETPAIFGPAMARLKELATLSVDALVAEGPVDADWRLMDAAAEVIALRKREQAIEIERAALYTGTAWTEEVRKHHDGLFRMKDDINQQAKNIMIAAGKMKATTPAGIYAVALMVRSYRSEASGKLSAMLADAVVDSPAIRAVLWPAGVPQLQAGD